ncbi:MAG: DUF6519 domain-containing protein [Desulfobacca sp.]|nr:DUF6519 domain-containing protein [Desulfobacca sp.]
MKTQISRNAYRQDDRYSGVYQQQGRMLTDADWNELVDRLKGELAQALQDVVGNGTPRLGAVRINNDRSIQPGDLYVDGPRAVLPGTQPVTAAAQPDLPGYPNLPATGPYQVYADVWERTVTALEDDYLRDAGLYGADTCTRTQTMLQIKTCPLTTDPETDIPPQGDARLSLELHSSLEAGDPCDPCAGLLAAGEGRVGNYLFRLEVHRVEGAANNPTRLILKWSSENGAEQYLAQSSEKMPPGFVSSHYLYEFFNLTSEKHLGVHLNPDFSPTPGLLKTVYEIPAGPADPKDFVRRWDGHCELTRLGLQWSLVQGWDKGVELSTTVGNTAPGYVSLGPELSVNLEAMLMTLELAGKTFVAGDFWWAPVREAVHLPGSEVLTSVGPEGIAHHYLKLAQVEADGTVTHYVNDADRRRHTFPPLTDLQAPDVGYQTDCDSGLFDVTHDNVKKALDRLCELAAEHVAYTADCNKGIFQNFIGTVKEALDQICNIQAQDVGFTKPCDTSIYQGKIVNTIADALTLLCDLKAVQVAYQPGPGCTFLDQPGITTVQDALDALCTRSGGGGCKVTIGPEGQFPTLEQALNTLLGQQIFDICLCLLPGEHRFGGTWDKKSAYDHFNLAISGCGRGTKIILEDPLVFQGLDSLTLEKFALDGSLQQERPLVANGCSALVLTELHHVGLARQEPLIRFNGGDRVRLEKNFLEAYTTPGLKNPQEVFSFESGLAKLFDLPRRHDFLTRTAIVAAELAKLPRNQRLQLVERMLAAVREMGNRLSPDEVMAYQQLKLVLVPEKVKDSELLKGLLEIRDQAHHAVAGRGVVAQDALASLAVTDNNIFGNFSFYGAPGGEELTLEELKQLAGLIGPEMQVNFRAVSSILQVWGNRLSRLTVSARMIEHLRNIIATGGGELTGLYRAVQLQGNSLARPGHQLVNENLTLAANDFQTVAERVGWVVGSTAIYTGNRIRRASPNGQMVGGGRIVTVVQELAQAANLPANSW